MKFRHWKSPWKSRVTLKILVRKKMRNAENFSVWCKFFLSFNLISIPLNTKRKVFLCDYPGLSMWFPLKVFPVWFPCFYRVKKKEEMCVIFNVKVLGFTTSYLMKFYFNGMDTRTHCLITVFIIANMTEVFGINVPPLIQQEIRWFLEKELVECECRYIFRSNDDCIGRDMVSFSGLFWRCNSTCFQTSEQKKTDWCYYPSLENGFEIYIYIF